MQTIITPAGIYTPPATALIQKVQLRIFESCPSATLCLMQYDRALPVIAVELFEGGNPYKVPENAAVNIRMVKPDKTTVYNPALGVSSDRKTTYIGITPQMTACFGSCAATLEIALNDGVLGTGLLRLNIEENPVSEDAVESSDEYLSLQEIVNKVQTYADQASTAAELAMNSVQAAVSVNAQTFTEEQKAQARENIGAASTMDTYGTVKYTEQKLTGEEKAQAVENIQAVSYRPGQNLGADGRTAARQNIGAVSKAQALTAVEEKYFYEMGEPLVPETTVNCDLANSSGIYYSSISNKGAAIIEMKPETVVVVVNGEQHKLTVQYSHNPDGTVNSAYIGNRSFLGTGYADNGEDYLFSYSATTGGVAVMYSRTSGKKTFSIHAAGNVLADEYLNPLVIKAKAQALSAAMQKQARENIGAVGGEEAVEAVEEKFFDIGLAPIYPEETVPCVATAFNGGTVYKGTLSANGADFYNANYEKVYVKIGGETVKCSVEYRMVDPGYKYAEIGNKHLRLSSAADTGEDFCIDYRLANGPSVIYTRAAGDVTFTVNTPAPVMKQEYLPPMGAADAVTYTAQTLTEEQKQQARENIGAAAVGEGGGEVGDITWDDISVTYSDTLTWDGNTDGLPNVAGIFFKVNDATPTYEALANGGYMKAGGEVHDFTQEALQVTQTGLILAEGLLVCPQEAAGKYDDALGTKAPEAGTYFLKNPYACIEEAKINGYTFPIKKEIPKNRLPKQKTFYANINEKVTAQEFRYLYIDPQLTVKATMVDVPESLDFVVGVVDVINETQAVTGVVRPWFAYSSLMAVYTGYNIVLGSNATKLISFVTAEYTGE